MDPARTVSNESPPKKINESPLHKIHEGLNESPLKHNINILKNKKCTDCCLKGVPPAAKNHDFSDFGLKGGPPAAKNHDLGFFCGNIDILSGSDVFYFFICSTPLSGSKI